MNIALLTMLLICGAAICHLLHIFKSVLFCWGKTKNIKRYGTVAEAWILQVQSINETGRSIPYVKLLLEVHPPEGGHFITEISSVFFVTELRHLRAGACLKVKYEPGNIEAVVLQKNNSTASGKTIVIHKPPLRKPMLVMAR